MCNFCWILNRFTTNYSAFCQIAHDTHTVPSGGHLHCFMFAAPSKSQNYLKQELCTFFKNATIHTQYTNALVALL